VAACVSGCGVCTECRVACDFTLQGTPQPQTHSATTLQNLQRCIFYWLILQKCNFSQAQSKLPEDGPGGPKHVGANIKYFNINFNILYA
jgi:hypothetical protein